MAHDISKLEAATPTYIVGDIHITDPAAYQAHVPRALATIVRFGGRVIAGGDSRVALLEGDPKPERFFIIEFPTADAARRWYQSDEYQEALKIRLSASHVRVAVSIPLPLACCLHQRLDLRWGQILAIAPVFVALTAWG